MNLKRFTRLLCLSFVMCLCAASAWAAGVIPVNGKTYTIRNAGRGTHLTTNQDNHDLLTLTGFTYNDPYQIWRVALNGTSITLQNVGDATRYVGAPPSGNDNARFPCSATAQAFTLVDRSTGDDTCFELQYNAGKAFHGAEGNVVIWASGDMGNNRWVFEEAELTFPKLVQIKPNRATNNYLVEEEGKLYHKSGMANQNAAKWILYPTGRDSYYLINYATGNFVQSVSKDAHVGTGSNPTVYAKTTVDGQTYIGLHVGNNYLNATTHADNKVVGWDNAMNDENNRWVIAETGTTFTFEQVQAKVCDGRFMTTPTAGVYFHLYNHGREQYVTDNTTLHGTSLNPADYKQLWKFEDAGNGHFYLVNALTQRKLFWGSEVKPTLSSEEATPLAVTNSNAANLIPQFTLTNPTVTNQNSNAIHLGNWGYDSDAIKYMAAAGASEWQIELAEEPTDLAQQQQIYIDNQDLIGQTPQYSAILEQIFSDAACTTIKPGLSNSDYNTLVAQLPALLRDMCNKIKNNQWHSYTSGRNWEKAFRIRDYKAVSNVSGMNNVVGVAYGWSRLNHPTGIKGNLNDMVAIIVGNDIPSGSTLKAELHSGYAMSGDQVTLQKGLNFIVLPRDCDIFIHYELNSAEDTPSNYLSNYPDIKVHIEGGEVFGMLDRNQDMTVERRNSTPETYTMTHSNELYRRDAANRMWKALQNDGLLFNHTVTQVKSECILFNFNTTEFLKACPDSIGQVTDIWDRVIKSEQWAMGMRNNWTVEGQNGELIDTYIPNFSRRYNNIYMATEREGGYMNATGYGAQYTVGTAASILNFEALKAGGAIWGPAHEHGHDHQRLIEMIGTAEVSNNCLANIANHHHGMLVSRGASLPDASALYAAGGQWFDQNIWVSCQMYHKLFLYYHVAGKDDTFYPRLFQKLRNDRMNHSQNVAVPANQDYLKFAVACAQVAGEDLSDFFEAYGFFRAISPEVSTGVADEWWEQVSGHLCRKIGDYGTYYVYTTPEMIAEAKATIKACGAKNTNLLFIDDRIEREPSTNEWAAPGQMKGDRGDGGTVGTLGNTGAVSAYRNETNPSVYSATYTVNNDGSVTVQMSGTGSVGYTVRDEEGNLLYFSPYNTFTIPANVVQQAADSPEELVAALPTTLKVATAVNQEVAPGQTVEEVATYAMKNDYILQGTTFNLGLLSTIDNVRKGESYTPQSHPLAGMTETISPATISRVTENATISHSYTLTQLPFTPSTLETDGTFGAGMHWYTIQSSGGNYWTYDSNDDKHISCSTTATSGARMLQARAYAFVKAPGNNPDYYLYNYLAGSGKVLGTNSGTRNGRFDFKAKDDATYTYHTLVLSQREDGHVIYHIAGTDCYIDRSGGALVVWNGDYATPADGKFQTVTPLTAAELAQLAEDTTMPFKVSTLEADGSFGSGMHWYQIRVNRNPDGTGNDAIKYCYATPSLNKVDNGPASALSPFNLFAFTGNMDDGFKIYSYAIGSDKVLWGTGGTVHFTAVGDVTAGTDWVAEYVGTSSNYGGARDGWTLKRKGTANVYLHDLNSTMGTWDSTNARTDAGSHFVFTEVSMEDITQPFKVSTLEADGSFGSGMHWYRINVNRDPNKYCWANASNVDNKSEDALSPFSVFAFTGNIWDGYKIYSYTVGPDKVLWGTGNTVPFTPVGNVATDTDWLAEYVPNSSNYGGARGGWTLKRKGTTNGYLHDLSNKLDIWDNGSARADAGSHFIFTEVSEEEIAQTTYTLSDIQNTKLYAIQNLSTGYLEGHDNKPYSSGKSEHTFSPDSTRFQWMIYNDGTGYILYNVATQAVLNSNSAATGQDNWELVTAPATHADAYITLAPDAAKPFVFNISDPQQVDNTNHREYLHVNTSYNYGITNWTSYSAAGLAVSGWMIQEVGEASEEILQQLHRCITLGDVDMDGDVDTDDLNLIKEGILGLEERYRITSDLNKDEQVRVGDQTKLIQILQRR